ncbi:MAG: dUTP diphosphatase [Clostridia bacterium]
MNSRGFKKIKKEIFLSQCEFDNEICLKLYEGIKLPHRKTKSSAGHDIFTYKDVLLKPNETKVIQTGIKAYMKPDEFLAIYIRSSFGFKYNIRLMNQVGIIDADYYNNPDNDGHIMVAIQNQGAKEKLIKKDEAFAQGIFQKYLISENDTTSQIRVSGVGSTDEELKR